MFIKISTRNLSMISMTFATKLVEYFIENDDFDNIVQSLEIKISSSHQKETKRSSNLSLKISMTSIIIHLFITSFTLYHKKRLQKKLPKLRKELSEHAEVIQEFLNEGKNQSESC